MGHEFLLWLAIILFSTKIMGLLIRRMGLPEVVAAALYMFNRMRASRLYLLP